MVDKRDLGGRTVLYGSVVAVAVASPLLGMMGFTLLASLTLLLVASPLLLLTSPVLLISGFILAAALAAFGVAGATALAGLWLIKWMFCSVRGIGRSRSMEWEENLFGLSKERIGETDLGGYSHRKLHAIPSENGDRDVIRK